MQPESTAVFEHNRSLYPSSENFSFTQDGHDSCGDHRVSGLDHDKAGDSGALSGPPVGQSGLNQPAQTSAPVDRVSQYEKAAARTPKNQEGLGFRVVAMTTPSYLSLEDFPNEVLTHILSHLPPQSLSSIALVSHRLHSLVTTPHAWRIAFSRYFPGPNAEDGVPLSAADQSDSLAYDKRHFSRLTALASWRSEYILRTRLLRSLARGKPAQFAPSKKHGTVRSANMRNGSAILTYTSQLLYPVSHVHGVFGNTNSKKEPLFMHGAAEQGIASASDPSTVKVGTWGVSDHQLFRHFAEIFPGDAEYGLGAGNIVGLSNRMDVSQPYGMIYGEACPQGRCYFISSVEQRGRFLNLVQSSPHPHLGIPVLNPIATAVTSVWIAKSSPILKLTGGLIGMMSGASSGVLTAYALGPHPTYEKRFERGQVTAKWVLSPGVPIIAIAVDERFSSRRYDRRRIWAAVLNALGEVFYISELPRQPETPSAKMSAEQLDALAWKTGRSARWELVELSRRTAKPDPFNREPVDGSYSPRSSSDSMKLSQEQVATETNEIQRFMSFKPKHFRRVCEGWDMRRDLIVDFAGDDAHGAGESMVVVTRGAGGAEKASIRRYTRKLSKVESPPALGTYPSLAESSPATSIFGGPVASPSPMSESADSVPPSRASSRLSDIVCGEGSTEWFISDFSFGDRKAVRITASALDESTYALLTADEDPLLGMSGTSAVSSATSSPLPHMQQSGSNVEVPGQRGRYMAVGTSTGLVFVWDVRSSTSKNPEIIKSIDPLRIIQTDSPQVSSLALTSLYLVHGGNDGLVQAWDPLASSTRPIRTINSRFSSRARRRLVQAEASILGVGNNFYATGAMCLDPDSTVLRGMVALGTHLRYWSYGSTAADQYKTSKRRFRRTQRGSNAAADAQRFNNSGRGALQDDIDDELEELKRQHVADRKQEAHLRNRFGTDLLGPGATEEEMLAYARLLSEEACADHASKRGGVAGTSVASTASSSDTVGRHGSLFPADELSSSSSPYEEFADDDLAPDIAEAIRLSLLDGPPTGFDESKPPETSDQHHHSEFFPDEPAMAESSNRQEMDDLEFAIQLSLAENAQQDDKDREEFPGLAYSQSGDTSKGKGRAV
ncbi:hypothetical protein BDW42DRAFT_56738 [Aspergillus taichungensis]|uniref:F-box domain-containing protein n=1 Tax=Aspergillus taichungensis TaxID=482145 RepID=A0A2J5I9P4_9EURO|nr:hypothetical protein BDW42DRAFT_56738 [Aspergillus taichungensis]